MAKIKKEQENKVVTRAEKKDAAKNVIKELLAVNPLKHNELIEETAKIYTDRFGGQDTENINDVKGRVGSVLDIMKKDGEIMYDGGRYALKARLPEILETEKTENADEKPAKTTRSRAKKAKTEESKTAEEKPVEKKTKKSVKTKKSETETAVAETEKPKKSAVTRKKTQETKAEEKENTADDPNKATPLPPAPLQPIAPVVPVTPEVAPEPIPEKENADEQPVKKPTRARAKKAEKPKAEKAEGQSEEKPVEKVAEEVKNPLVVKEKGEVAKKAEVMDMSFLFGTKPVQKTEVKTEKSLQKPTEKTEIKVETKAEEKPVENSAEKQEKQEKPALKVVKTDEKRLKKVVQTLRKAEKKPQTADERLRESFLRKLRSLGGDYFEYYSVYLLERYSMKNGRRLEGMKISGGDHDGGIDGEIELTDKFGFRETIYIQSKNWNPDKGDERLWVVGETLLQQFIGACACRQAQDKKQHCRGIFITTSRFTPDAKRILDAMSDKIVGYDGEDLYEAAKECQFGVVYENGNWKLDEKLLSGTKAFFNML